MGLPIKGVILSLEPFTLSVNRVAHSFVMREYGIEGYSRNKSLSELYMNGLIRKLLEDRFLIQVMLKREGEPHSMSPRMEEFRNAVREDVPDYEILFSQCFDRLIRLEHFPDMVYLDKIGDSVIVTWK